MLDVMLEQLHIHASYIRQLFVELCKLRTNLRQV